ncbi:DUF1080 domain-containing protein [bacterium]|nr:DUF1080 domain-containing protein [bacterium]
MLRNIIFYVFSILLTSHAFSQTSVTIPADTAHWDLQGKAKIADYQGHSCIFLEGGVAVLKEIEIRDGVIDVDINAPIAPKGFFGIEFRATADGLHSEYVYLRPHKSGLPDAIQYTPVLNTGLNWQIYSGPGFTAGIDIPKDTWFHLRLEITGAQAKLFVGDMNNPALVMSDLKTDVQKGQIALSVLTGPTYFSNFQIKKTPDAAWKHTLPPMPRGILTKWSLSRDYDGLKRNAEIPLTSAEMDTMPWQNVEAESPGFVTIYRYRMAPHLRVTFATDFSTRLDPQPGTKLIYARTNIESDRDQVKKLHLGYSDEVCVFLNGKIIFQGRSAQNFRDPGFLGIMDPENDAVYLPLKKGRNELVLAIRELGGGWGFIGRLDE